MASALAAGLALRAVTVEHYRIEIPTAAERAAQVTVGRVLRLPVWRRVGRWLRGAWRRIEARALSEWRRWRGLLVVKPGDRGRV